MPDKKGLSRRSFLKATGALAGLSAVGMTESANAEAVEAKTVHNPRITGEPYELAGKRMVFVNWYYVRSGRFLWVNDAGKVVHVAGNEGPFGAKVTRTDQAHGVRISAEQGERMGPLMRFEKPWESRGISISVLLQDKGVYRGWGNIDPTKMGDKPNSHPCYFESNDGIHWERPDLGIFEFMGSRRNNLLVTAPSSIFIDPTAPAEARYKGVSLLDISHQEFEQFKKRRPDAWNPLADRKDVGHVYAIFGYTSPDGVNWKKLDEPFTVEHSDTQITAYYDAQLAKYVIYTRNYMIGPRSDQYKDENFRTWWGGDVLGPARRSIGRTESDTFGSFPLSQVIVEPGPEMLPTDTLYTNAKTTIPGAPDQHLMFPAIWHTSDDTTSIALASSYNGRIWHFVPGSPVFRTAEFGEWDGGCVFASPNLVELPNGDWVLPYQGYNFPHKYPRGQFQYLPGYIVWPKGRLVSIEAPDLGEFTTVAFMPPGRKVRINALTQRAGGILVEAADIDGNPLPGHSFADARPIVGDQYRTPITWKSGDDLGTKDGQPVVLKFKLDKARVFGLDFE